MKNFIVYKSSAGSGKTYTLVREYIALALQDPGYFRHILAITFTNKAANEMKQRIMTSLLHLSEPLIYKDTSAVCHMMADLSDKTGDTPDEISSKAGLLLRAILHEYDDFAVRTIDSFVTRIIRTFAHDLHLPVDFEIEMDKDVLLDEAVHNLVGKAGIDKEITKILVEYSESKAEDEKSWQIENDLKSAGSHLFSEEGYTQTNRLKEITPSAILSIIRRIKQFRETFEQSLSAPAKKAVLLIAQNRIPLDSFYYGKNGIGSFFSKLAGGTPGLPNSYVLTTISQEIWYAPKLPQDRKLAIDSIKHQLLAHYRECEDVLTDYPTYCLFGLINRYIYQLGVMSEIEKELDLIRKDHRVLHISEFNKRITDLILKEPVPFIYERTGEKYSNYLIDEFQDTSELQWKNLLPLVSNSLASGHFNLVVGDGKQAIYRFRNGKVEQFMLLPGLPQSYDRAVFGDAEKAMGNNYREELLSVNYRSLPAIIEFNNDFFSFVSSGLDDSLRPIYRDHEQKPLAGKEGGLVSLDFLEYGTASESDDANPKPSTNT